jgi:hypothetical protein
VLEERPDEIVAVGSRAGAAVRPAAGVRLVEEGVGSKFKT